MMIKVLKENIWYIVSIIGLIVCFYIIKNTSLYNYVIEFDYKVITFFSRIVDDRFTSLFKFITNFGDWYIPIVIIVCIFFIIKNKYYFYIMSGSYAFVGLIAFITKTLVARPRPLVALITIPSSYSFPSGHTMTSLVFYIIFSYIITLNSEKKSKILFEIGFAILIFLIGLSRVYLGVHYFSDVIGGIILAIPCVLMSINIINKYFKEKLK